MKPKRFDRIYVAGHRGLIGSAVVRRLQREGGPNPIVRTRQELDLRDSDAVDAFFDAERPDAVVLAAGRVGGIIENTRRPADFIVDNLTIQLNVLKAAHRVGVRDLILFASSCMYPREADQPMSESLLFAGHPEPTSMSYAVSKMAGMQLCLAYNQQFPGTRFIPAIPNSAFGPNDDFDIASSHVLPALMRRFHEAKASRDEAVVLWGSGRPRREFVHADDVADASLTILRHPGDIALPINIGSGSDLSIRELAVTMAEVVGFRGEIRWDETKPDGAPRKLLDSARLRSLGWSPKIDFRRGLVDTFAWFVTNVASNKEIPE